jgi:hypothetical protein
MSDQTQTLAGPIQGETAQALYQRLESLRWITLERARDCAAVTIPAIQPPQYSNDQTQLPTPYQSLGARGVNNLTSKLLLAMFPPGQPFFRLDIQKGVAQALGESLSQVEEDLASVESVVTTHVEQSQTRPIMANVLKRLIVTGNVLLHIPDHKNIRSFRLDQYVIVRDAMDKPLRAVVEEKTVAEAIKPEVCEHCAIPAGVIKDGKMCVQEVRVYTDINWNYQTGRVETYQEINGKKVPGSEGDAPMDAQEWLPLRWHRVPGRDYGMGMVEEYLGDLRSLEALSMAVVQFAAAAAKIVVLVHPNATTNVQDLNNAESGDAIVGSKADLDIFQLEKQADFQSAVNIINSLTTQLCYAFLLQTGTTRNAERVTAEEIRATAQELEDALGGVYTVLSEDMQLPMVNRWLAVMTLRKLIPPLPKGALRPVVVTGFEALGRNQQLNKLRQMLADLNTAVGPQVMQQRVNFTELARRFSNGYGIEDQSTLWLTDDQVKQNTQAQSAQEAMVKAAPQAAGPLIQHALGQGGGS